MNSLSQAYHPFPAETRINKLTKSGFAIASIISGTAEEKADTALPNEIVLSHTPCALKSMSNEADRCRPGVIVLSVSPVPNEERP